METHTHVYILVAFLLGTKGLLLNLNQTQGPSMFERLNALEKQLADEKRQRYLLQVEYSEEKERIAELRHLQDTMNETNQKLLQDYNSDPKRFQDISTQIRGALLSIYNLDSKHNLDIQKVLDALRDVQTSLTDITSNQSDIFQLQRHFREKQNVLSNMLDAVKRNQTTNKEKIKSLRASLVSLANSQKNLQSTVNSTSNKQTSLNTQFNKIQRSNVAFVAELSHDVVNPQDRYHIIFDNVKLNIGENYSANNGVFTAPYPGIYHFALELTSPPQSSDHTLHVQIIKNSVSVAVTFLDSNTQQYLRRTGSIILELDTSDLVWCQTDHPFDSNTLTSGNTYSMFSGFIIHPL